MASRSSRIFPDLCLRRATVCRTESGRTTRDGHTGMTHLKILKNFTAPHHNPLNAREVTTLTPVLVLHMEHKRQIAYYFS
jgi:hypothetical protein